MTNEGKDKVALSQDLSFTTKLVMMIQVLILVGFLLNLLMYEKLKGSIGNMDVKMTSTTAPKQVVLSDMSEDEIRNLGGRLEATQTGNVLYFQAFTVGKHPNGEKLRVPIASMLEVMTAIQNTTKTLGPSHIAMSVSPEIGVYEGKLVLMGAVVTLPPATLFK